MQRHIHVFKLTSAISWVRSGKVICGGHVHDIYAQDHICFGWRVQCKASSAHATPHMPFLPTRMTCRQCVVLQL